MKVALLFFGQPRYLDDDRAYNDYKRLILDRYDTDVYIHTWFDEAGGKYDVSTWGLRCTVLKTPSSCPIRLNDWKGCIILKS